MILEGLDRASRQGDRRLADLLSEAGVEISDRRGALTVSGPRRRPVVADLADCPDLFPALCAAASCGVPGSRLTGLEHLRHKESDRLSVMVDNLTRLGARLELDGTQLTVEAPVVRRSELRQVTAAADHRIAMAMAVTALGAGPLELDDAACVQKSFPGFWEQWERILG